MAPLSDTAKTALVARLRMARSGKRISEDALVQPLANQPWLGAGSPWLTFPGTWNMLTSKILMSQDPEGTLL